MGLYNADGQRQVNVVDGTTRTGLYSADGQYNGVMNDGISVYKGAQHPCGALNVTLYDTNSVNVYSPNGSLVLIASSNGYALKGTGKSTASSITADNSIITADKTGITADHG